jgi:hypothetical protein
LTEDDEYADGDCRGVDEGGKDNADKEPDEGIICFPEKVEKKGVLFERRCRVGDKV